MASDAEIDRIIASGVKSMVIGGGKRLWAVCKSPIEKAFLDALYKIAAQWEPMFLVAHSGYYFPKPADDPLSTDPDDMRQTFFHGYHDTTVFVWAQEELLGHKVDFALYWHKTDRMAIIECDGYQWHSDKDQFDKDRDFDGRVIAETKGRLPVFRFSGRQINSNAEACVGRVLGYMFA